MLEGLAKLRHAIKNQSLTEFIFSKLLFYRLCTGVLQDDYL